jgi:hypothetical protein
MRARGRISGLRLSYLYLEVLSAVFEIPFWICYATCLNFLGVILWFNGTKVDYETLSTEISHDFKSTVCSNSSEESLHISIYYELTTDFVMSDD